MSNSQTTPARPAVEIAESISLIRSLVSLATRQIEKAQVDLGVARVGLSELEAELVTRGVQS